MRKMSARSLAQLAVDRDVNRPGDSVASNSTDVLVAAVPSEALAAYTAVIGVVLASDIGSGYGPFRWSAFGAFVALAVLAPVVFFRNRASESERDTRHAPYFECITAGVAAAAWGLVMPGSPLAMIFKGNALVFATTAILVGGATVVGLATQPLRTANGKNPAPGTAGDDEGLAAAQDPDADLAAGPVAVAGR
jgi:hypothetical protein